AAEGVERGRLALARRRRAARAAGRAGGAGGAPAVARRLLALLGGALGGLGAEELEHLFTDVLDLDLQVAQDLRGDALALADEAEEEVVGPDVGVAEVARLLEGELEDLLRPRREGELPHRDHRRAGRDELLDLLADLLQVDVE